MRPVSRLAACVLVLSALASCAPSRATPDPSFLVTCAQQSWQADWHGVWQIEWAGAPAPGPLVAEVWHAADGRLRIETLEAASPALNGLTLVSDGSSSYLYELRSDQVQIDSAGQMRIPLASDALDAMAWLVARLNRATVRVVGHDVLESGPATRLEILLDSSEGAELWVHDETGLPARLELHSANWGEAVFTSRSLDAPVYLHPGLFQPPQPRAEPP